MEEIRIGRIYWKFIGGGSWRRRRILEKKQDLAVYEGSWRRRRILEEKKDMWRRRRILEYGGRRILDEHERRRIPRAPSYQEAHFPSLVAA